MITIKKKKPLPLPFHTQASKTSCDPSSSRLLLGRRPPWPGEGEAVRPQPRAAPTFGVVSKLVDVEPVLAFGQPADGPGDFDGTVPLRQREHSRVGGLRTRDPGEPPRHEQGGEGRGLGGQRPGQSPPGGTPHPREMRPQPATVQLAGLGSLAPLSLGGRRSGPSAQWGLW